MSFLYPAAGLLALLTLPLILWLHRRRRPARRVVVASLEPWRALLAPRPPRARRVPPSLLLALHLAAAAVIALALAGPLLGAAPASDAGLVLLLDGSTSMAAEGRWAEARARAEALASASAGPAALVTLGPRPRLAARGDAGALRAAMAGLEPGGGGIDLSQALALAEAALPGARRVLITDGGLPPLPEAASDVEVVLVGASAGASTDAENSAVLALAADPAAGVEGRAIFARLAHYGDEARSAGVELRADGERVERRELRLRPGEPLDTVWRVPPEARTAELRLDPGDALARDDRAHLPLEPRALSVQLAGESEALRRALRALPGATLEERGLGTLRADPGVDVTALVGALPERLPPGGLLVFAPEGDARLGPAGPPRSARLEGAADAALLRGLDLAGARIEGLRLEETPGWARTWLTADGRPVVLAGELEGRRTIVLDLDPDAGDLAERVAFPLLVARAVDWVAPRLPPPAVPAGEAVPVPVEGATVRGPGGPGGTGGAGGREGVAREVTARFDDTAVPGLYTLRRGDAALRFAVHAGDPEESDLRPRVAASPGDADASMTRGADLSSLPLWAWAALLALALVLAEAALRARAARTLERAA